MENRLLAYGGLFIPPEREEDLRAATMWMNLENITAIKDGRHKRPRLVGLPLCDALGIGTSTGRRQVGGWKGVGRGCFTG